LSAVDGVARRRLLQARRAKYLAMGSRALVA
jgi:hypothetical protein